MKLSCTNWTYQQHQNNNAKTISIIALVVHELLNSVNYRWVAISDDIDLSKFRIHGLRRWQSLRRKHNNGRSNWVYCKQKLEPTNMMNWHRCKLHSQCILTWVLFFWHSTFPDWPLILYLHVQCLPKLIRGDIEVIVGVFRRCVSVTAAAMSGDKIRIGVLTRILKQEVAQHDQLHDNGLQGTTHQNIAN